MMAATITTAMYRGVEIRKVDNPEATRPHWELWLPAGQIMRHVWDETSARAAVDAYWAEQEAMPVEEDIPFDVDLAGSLAERRND